MNILIPHSVRGRVALLIALAFLPAVGLYGFAYFELQQLIGQEQEAELQRLAKVATADYQRLVEDSRALLASLTHLEEIREVQRPGCETILAGVLDRNPQYTAIGLIDDGGYRRCGALPVDEPLYLGDRRYVQRAIGTGGFSVGDYQLGRITGKPGVGMAYPILDPDGEIATILAATIDLERLAESGSATMLPEGATLTILDRSGNVLVRLPEAGDWLGKSAPDGFPGSIVEGTDAVPVEALDLDGAERLFVVTPLLGEGSSPEGVLSVGFSGAGLAADVDRIFRTDFALLGIMALLLLVVAWGVAQKAVVAPVLAIIRAERRLADGDYSARTGVDYDMDDELSRVARTFDEMAARLEEREATHAE